MMDRRSPSPPPRCTTVRNDRQVVRMEMIDGSATSRTIAQQIQSLTHHSSSARTINRRLRQSEMSIRCHLLHLPLTGNHRRWRRQ
ncbi:transposable element Tc1 transposase [Trichonephila clavipes]|nr:transposable element Tc1 transposase [Trichonephila clavipes]